MTTPTATDAVHRFLIDVPTDGSEPTVTPIPAPGKIGFNYAVHFCDGSSDGDAFEANSRDAICRAIAAAIDNENVASVDLFGHSGNLIAIVIPQPCGVQVIFRGWRP